MVKPSSPANADQTSIHEPSADHATRDGAVDTTGTPSSCGQVDESFAADAAGAGTAPTGFGPPAMMGEVGTLGPYRLLKELGKGGMGAVYAAIDTRLDRRLALKVMLPQYATSPSARERFLREARATARVKHEHVVTVYEADERNGVPYIAMEYLEGYPLDAYLRKKGNPSFSQVLRLAADAAAGLAAAHRQGLVHRDIKPGNLWLEAPAGRIKVLDFGLARPVDTDVELTKSGAIVGTPSYMSPEQARGEKVDHRTDLFSLGALIYRLVTGRLPFEGPNTMAVLMALATQEPPSVRELNPSVPEPLAELIHQLLAKSADARPSSADEVVKRLRAIAQPRAVRATVPAASEVVHVPIEVTAVAAANPFADIDVTKTSTPLKPAPAPLRQKPRRPWLIATGLAGMAALLIVVFSGIIIKITNKDGTVTEVKVAPGSKVEVIVEEKTPPQVRPGVAIPAAAGDPDRKAAEYIVSCGGVGRLDVNGQNREFKTAADLPKERFTLTFAYLGNTAATDGGLTSFMGCKGLVGLDLSGTKVSDAGLEHFKDSKGLAELSLRGNTTVTAAGLAHFKDCKGLTQLRLLQSGVTDAGLEHFKDCKGLTSLELQQTAVTDAGLANFKDCKQLTYLDLGGTKVSDEGLANFKDCKQLTYLDLSGTKVTDAGLAHFKDRKELIQLNLGYTSVTDAGVAHFKDCTRLKVLGLRQMAVSDAGVAYFKDCKGLTVLQLQNTAVTDAGLANFKDCKQLTLLGLNATGVTDAGLVNFKDCKGLTSVDLNGTRVTDAGLAQLKDCTRLTNLYLKGTKVTGDGVAGFHAAVPGCRIEHDGGITDAGNVERKAVEYVLSIDGKAFINVNGREHHIGNAADLPDEPFTLAQLSFHHNKKVTDQGLANLKDCKAITSINLYATAISDAGLSHFSQFQNVKQLELSQTNFTDAGLAAFKNCRSLNVLSLGATNVTDAGLVHFRDCKELTQLSLGSTRISDAGLGNFKDCQGLTSLNLSATQITDAGLTNFKDCKSLNGIDLRYNKITDAGLANFKGCRSLKELYLGTHLDQLKIRVTDAGLAIFGDCKEFTTLVLCNTKVTNAGVARFKDCQGLAVLDLSGTALTDEGMTTVQEFKNLQDLKLVATGVTDTGLALLKGCKMLRKLELNTTKVTAAGIADFHAAVPGCRITHDGGVIEPKP